MLQLCVLMLHRFYLIEDQACFDEGINVGKLTFWHAIQLFCLQNCRRRFIKMLGKAFCKIGL